MVERSKCDPWQSSDDTEDNGSAVRANVKGGSLPLLLQEDAWQQTNLSNLWKTTPLFWSLLWSLCLRAMLLYVLQITSISGSLERSSIRGNWRRYKCDWFSMWNPSTDRLSWQVLTNRRFFVPVALASSLPDVMTSRLAPEYDSSQIVKIVSTLFDFATLFCPNCLVCLLSIHLLYCITANATFLAPFLPTGIYYHVEAKSISVTQLLTWKDRRHPVSAAVERCQQNADMTQLLSRDWR